MWFNPKQISDSVEFFTEKKNQFTTSLKRIPLLFKCTERQETCAGDVHQCKYNIRWGKAWELLLSSRIRRCFPCLLTTFTNGLEWRNVSNLHRYYIIIYVVFAHKVRCIFCLHNIIIIIRYVADEDVICTTAVR